MKTKVIFRKESDGSILAVFPGLMGNPDPYRTCACYVHIGQHGTMNVDYFNETRPAKPEEYKDLKEELESLGYDLRICQRMSYRDLQDRIKQTDPIWNAK